MGRPRGGASLGAPANRILDAYYPGTATATLAGQRISVSISADDGVDVVVAAQSGLVVTDRASGGVYRLPSRASGTSATAWRAYLSDGAEQLGWYDGHAWHQPWVAPDRHSSWAGPLAFSASASGSDPSPALTLLPAGVRALPRVAGGSAHRCRLHGTVDNVDLDTDVAGVVPFEMGSAGWYAAALQS